MARLFLRWRLLVAVVLLTGLGAALIAGELRYFRHRQEEQAATLADQAVADRVETARSHLKHEEWDKAITLLREALEVEKARNTDLVPPLVLTAQQGQARALLEAARAAILSKDLDRACALLGQHRDHPQATDPTVAVRLLADLDRATDVAIARNLLGRWSDEALAQFASSGELSGEDYQGDPSLRAVFIDTLQRQLPDEERRRQEQREARARQQAERAVELARQKARLRESAAYRDFLAFLRAARTRLDEEDRLAQRQERALARLFTDLAITSSDERDNLRASFTADRRGARQKVLDSVAHKQAEIKETFRKSAAIAPTDAEVFDRLVDDAVATLGKARDVAD